MASDVTPMQEEILSCFECSPVKIFQSHANLTKHVRDCHVDQVRITVERNGDGYECPKCADVKHTVSALRKHLQRLHCEAPEVKIIISSIPIVPKKDIDHSSQQNSAIDPDDGTPSTDAVTEKQKRTRTMEISNSVESEEGHQADLEKFSKRPRLSIDLDGKTVFQRHLLYVIIMMRF
ncbi:unnamed protein product [Umbelopsis vinacea]